MGKFAYCPWFGVPEAKVSHIIFVAVPMTISSSYTTRLAGPFSGNGSTTVFSFSFKVFLTSDVVVISTTAGVDTVLTLGTHYSVSLNANQDSSPGGSVTMVTAPASGSTLTVTSGLSYLQPLSLTNGGPFYPQNLNDEFDRVTIQIQQMRLVMDDCLKIPFTASSSISAALPLPTASSVIGWSASGLALQNYTIASLSDYRAKQDIRPFADGLTELERLQVWRFRYRDQPEQEAYGFIAHELAAVKPEAVLGEKDAVNADGSPAYQVVMESKLVPLLVAAIQELKERVLQLENEVRYGKCECGDSRQVD